MSLLIQNNVPQFVTVIPLIRGVKCQHPGQNQRSFLPVIGVVYNRFEDTTELIKMAVGGLLATALDHPCPTRSPALVTICARHHFLVTSFYPCGIPVFRFESHHPQQAAGQARRKVFTLLMSVFACWVASCPLAFAQESDVSSEVAEEAALQSTQYRVDPNDAEPPAELAGSSPRSVPNDLRLNEEDHPAIFYLPDAEGKLQRVLGFRYEDFLKAQGVRSAVEKSEAVLEACEVEGKTVGDFAELEAKLTIEKSSKSRVALPISLGSTVLEEIRFPEEAGNCAIALDNKRQAYVLWLAKELNGRVVVEVSFSAKVESVAGTRRLAISLPTAAKSSLAVEIEGSEIELSAPGSRVLAQNKTDDDRSRLEATGVNGAIELTWLPKLIEGSAPRQIEATLDIQAVLDLEEVQYRCLLGTNTGNQPIESYQVQLPEGFQLTEELSDEFYAVRRLLPENRSQANQREGDKGAAAESFESELLEIRFPAPVTSPPLVSFSLQNRLRSNQTARTLSLAIPRLVGAYRQSGFLSVVTSDRLQSYFDLTGKIDQISPDDLPQSLSEAKVAAAFQYAGTDGEVITHTQPRIERIRVRPQYELLVDAEEATLVVDFRYEIAAAKLFSLRIDLKDWELTEQPVESGGLVDRSRLHRNSENILILPLESPAEETASVRFLLRRSVEQGTNKWMLPEALGAAMLPGQLSLAAADSLRVTAQFEESKGVAIARGGGMTSVKPDSAAVDDATDAVEPTTQLSVFSTDAVLALAISDRPREIETTSELKIRVDEKQVKIAQAIGFDVRFEPVQQFELLAPRELWQAGKLDFTWNSRSIEAQAVEAEDLREKPGSALIEDFGKETATELIRLRVNLPKSLIGSGLLNVVHAVPRVTESTGGIESLRLFFCEPLIRPKHTLASVTSNSDLQVTLDVANSGSEWATVKIDASTPNQFYLERAGGVSVLPLIIDRSQSQDSSRLRLDRTWVQTWLAGNTRQDRSVMRFASDRPQVQLALPEVWSAEGIEVLLDGQPIDSIRVAEQELVIDLPKKNELSEHTLEVRTLTANEVEAWQKIELWVPELMDASADSPFVWQLVVPKSMSLVGKSGNLVGEYRLGWSSFQWGRQPLRGQQDLERWANASPGSLQPSAGANAYIFTSLETPSVVEARFVPAQLLQGLAIAIVFLVGAISIYTTLWRRPLFWLTSSCLLLLIVFAQPHMAFFAAQVVIIAGGLVVGTALLRRWLTVEPSTLSSVLPSESIDIRTISTGIWKGAEEIDSAATVAPSPSKDAPGSGISNSGTG